MASLYLDTSALIKLYIEEAGTPRVLELTESPDENHLALLDLTFLEIRSAVRRREREGDIPGPWADRILLQIERDGSSIYITQPTTSSVIEQAARLLDLYPLRTYDALQLAGCLTIRRSAPPPVTFVCADSRLSMAAESEGLPTINPLDPKPSA